MRDAAGRCLLEGFATVTIQTKNRANSAKVVTDGNARSCSRHSLKMCLLAVLCNAISTLKKPWGRVDAKHG